MHDKNVISLVIVGVFSGNGDFEMDMILLKVKK
jgi:hypothetical protein